MSLQGRSPWHRPPGQVCSLLEAIPQCKTIAYSKEYDVVATNGPRNDAKENTLSDMDAEIAALEGKLSKARLVKAGMMSVLLGGE